MTPIRWQYWLPQHLLSRFAGWLARSRYPWLKDYLIDYFLKRYAVNMEIAVEPDPHRYASFNHFFTRALKPEARPIVTATNAIACPVDGVISQIGAIQNNGGRIFQAKGFDFSAAELLGDTTAAKAFAGGIFATFYLAPHDYHRVHSPIDGILRTMRYMPGQLFSVNPQTAAQVPRLFARNERIVLMLDTAVGPVAIVLVGAMLVGSMSTPWHGRIAPSKMQTWQYGHDDNARHESNENHDAPQIKRGQEVGHFELGSTVLILFPPHVAQWAQDMQPEQMVQMGQLLGTLF